MYSSGRRANENTLKISLRQGGTRMLPDLVEASKDERTKLDDGISRHLAFSAFFLASRAHPITEKQPLFNGGQPDTAISHSPVNVSPNGRTRHGLRLLICLLSPLRKLETDRRMMTGNAILKIYIALLIVRIARGEETEDNADILAELPLRELLAQKKNLGRNLRTDKTREALSLLENGSGKGRTRKKPLKRTFHEEDSEEEHGWVHEKKKRDGSHDLLNTSLTVLSYLAFGGYLICIIVNSLRENKRRFQLTYPSATGSGYNQVGNFGSNRRPVRVKHPNIQTVHHEGKKRRKRFDPHPYHWYHHREANPRTEESDYDFTILNIMD